MVNRIEFWKFMTLQRECVSFKVDYEIGGNVRVSSTDRSRSQRWTMLRRTNTSPEGSYFPELNILSSFLETEALRNMRRAREIWKVVWSWEESSSLEKPSVKEEAESRTATLAASGQRNWQQSWKPQQSLREIPKGCEMPAQAYLLNTWWWCSLGGCGSFRTWDISNKVSWLWSQPAGL